MTDERHRIFKDLERLHQIKTVGERGLSGKTCPIYSPPQPCVGEKCLWYDSGDMSCWILNPKPKKAPD